MIKYSVLRASPNFDVSHNNSCVANTASDIVFQELCHDCKLSVNWQNILAIIIKFVNSLQKNMYQNNWQVSVKTECTSCTEDPPKYCLVVIKLEEYQKGFQIFYMGRCHFSQYSLSPPPNFFLSINCSKSAECISYVRLMSYVTPLKILQHIFCLQTNTHHAAGKSSQPGSVVWRAGCGKKRKSDCFSLSL